MCGPTLGRPRFALRVLQEMSESSAQHDTRLRFIVDAVQSIIDKQLTHEGATGTITSDIIRCIDESSADGDAMLLVCPRSNLSVQCAQCLSVPDHVMLVPTGVRTAVASVVDACANDNGPDQRL